MIKRFFSLFLVTVMLLFSVSMGAYGAYGIGYMLPKNSKFTKTLSTVNLYGKYDYLNFLIESNIPNGDFAYAIYSDSKYKKLVTYGYTTDCAMGEYTYTPWLNMSKMKSGTYYGMTFAADGIEEGDVDNGSLQTFKIKVNRKVDFNKKVVILKSVKSSVEGPVIRWYKLAGAKKYYIYRRYPNSKKWKKIGSTTSTKFVDKSVASKSDSYIYTVKAVDKNGQVSRYNYAGLYIEFVGAPEISSLKVSGNNYTLKWNKISGGEGYIIYRRTNGGGWREIASINNAKTTTFVDKTKKTAGVKYWYTVKAEDVFESTIKYSKYHSGKSVIYVTAPTVSSISIKEDNIIRIKWNSVGDAKYDIYRKTKDSGWQLLCTDFNGTVYEDKSEKQDSESYIYTVRAKLNTRYGNYTGHYAASDDIFFIAMPEINNIEANENGINISWNPVESATSYIVYNKAVGGDGPWQKLGVVFSGKTNFIDTLSDVNGQYIYTVCAYREMQKGSYNSAGVIYDGSEDVKSVG